MTLEKLREELIKDIIEALDENVVWPDIDGTKVPSLVTQIIVDSFDEYECENKVGVYAGKLFEKANAKKLGAAK